MLINTERQKSCTTYIFAFCFFLNFKTKSYLCKLTRNKNARHILPHQLLTVAMVGIICLYMHFVLYIFHTRSLFSNTYTTSGHMKITAQNARARRALQLRDFSMQKFVFQIAVFITEQKSCVKKD